MLLDITSSQLLPCFLVGVQIQWRISNFLLPVSAPPQPQCHHPRPSSSKTASPNSPTPLPCHYTASGEQLIKKGDCTPSRKVVQLRHFLCVCPEKQQRARQPGYACEKDPPGHCRDLHNVLGHYCRGLGPARHGGSAPRGWCCRRPDPRHASSVGTDGQISYAGRDIDPLV